MKRNFIYFQSKLILRRKFKLAMFIQTNLGTGEDRNDQESSLRLRFSAKNLRWPNCRTPFHCPLPVAFSFINRFQRQNVKKGKLRPFTWHLSMTNLTLAAHRWQICRPLSLNCLEVTHTSKSDHLLRKACVPSLHRRQTDCCVLHCA